MDAYRFEIAILSISAFVAVFGVATVWWLDARFRKDVERSRSEDS